MNYITEQLCFLRYLRNHKLSSGEVALWYALFASSNNGGRLGKEFSVSDSMLRIYSGLGQTRLAEARKNLEKLGLLTSSSYQPREIRTYRLTSMEQLMNPSADPQFFLPDSASESIDDTNPDSVCENMGESMSVSKSVTCINKNINTKQNIKQEEERVAHGPFENVMLTESQLKNLRRQFPNSEDVIRRMSLYLESTGKNYRNHYAALLKWAEEENAKKTPAQRRAEEDQALEDAIALAHVKKYQAEVAAKELTNRVDCDNIVLDTR